MNPSERIDELIAELTDWRGKTFASIRKSILEADREIIEEWKWMGSPVWSRDGIIAVANAHKKKVKLTFSHGASLPDPDKLFNAGLEGNARRAIDFFEGDKVNEPALKNLVRAAVDYNQIKLKEKVPSGTRAKVHKSKKTLSYSFFSLIVSLTRVRRFAGREVEDERDASGITETMNFTGKPAPRTRLMLLSQVAAVRGETGRLER